MRVGFFKRITAASALAMGLFLASCGSDSADFYPLQKGGETVFGAPKKTSDVLLFITKKPDFQYKELGMITYEVPQSFADEPAIYEKLREKAAQIGADAIIIMNSQSSFEQRQGAIMLDYSYVPIQSDTTVTRIKYRAMAIARK